MASGQRCDSCPVCRRELEAEQAQTEQGNSER
jgi:hypothetical protein